MGEGWLGAPLIKKCLRKVQKKKVLERGMHLFERVILAGTLD